MTWILDILDSFNTFTADVFWNIATSPTVLVLIGAIAAAAFIVAHVPLIERFFPVVIPYTRAALVAQLVTSALLMFLLGFRVADDRAEVARLKNDREFSQFMLDQQRQVADAADELKRKADAEAAAARNKLNEYEGKFGTNPGARNCPVPDGYPDWLRSLQRRSHRAGADQPQRGLVARVRAIGGERR